MTDHALSEVDACDHRADRRAGVVPGETRRPRQPHRTARFRSRARPSAVYRDAARHDQRAPGRCRHRSTGATEAARLPPDDTSYYRADGARQHACCIATSCVANEQRQRMRRAWAEFFKDWDVFLCPAAASPAQPHDHAGERWERTIEVNGHRVPTTDQMFWAGISCFFLLPATVAPLGFHADGPAVRRADRRPAIRRPHHDPVRADDGTILAGFRAAPRMGPIRASS